MSKIVRFKTPQDKMIETLENLLVRAKNGEMTGFIFAAKCPDGTIATCWSNVDIGDRNELCSHTQTDIIFDVMAANMDRLVEYV